MDSCLSLPPRSFYRLTDSEARNLFQFEDVQVVGALKVVERTPWKSVVKPSVEPFGSVLTWSSTRHRSIIFSFSDELFRLIVYQDSNAKYDYSLSCPRVVLKGGPAPYWALAEPLSLKTLYYS